MCGCIFVRRKVKQARFSSKFDFILDVWRDFQAVMIEKDLIIQDISSHACIKRFVCVRPTVDLLAKRQEDCVSGLIVDDAAYRKW